MKATARGRPKLVRGLGPLEATTIVVGGIIGSGIFIAPSIIAAETGAPGLSLIVWGIAAGLAFCGALCYAELGAAIRRTGGTYTFLRHAFGTPFLAFLFGWTFFFVAGPGAIAAIGTAFATYSGYFLGQFVPFDVWVQRAVAFACIVLLTVVNYTGVRAGGRVQNVFTALKVAALLGIVSVAIAGGRGSASHFAPLLPEGREAGDTLAAVGTAMIPALFAFGGWSYSTYVAGEVRDPRRTLPLSIFVGMAIVIAIYLTINIAYMYVLPFDQLARSPAVATETMEAVVGGRGAVLVAVAVMISTFGALNATILTYARIAFAMAQDGLFFRSLQRVHPHYRTPGNAIAAQAAIACAFALSGGYEQILSYFSFVEYLFFSLGVATVIILRRREPNLERPYRVWLYPLPPVLFLIVSAWYLGNLLVHRSGGSMVGVVLLLTGIPFYLAWRRPNRKVGH